VDDCRRDGVLNFASYLRRNTVLTETFAADDVPDNALFIFDLKAWLYSLYRPPLGWEGRWT